MYRTTPPVVRLEDYHPPEFLIDQVDLRFDLDVDQTAVQAEISLRRNPAATRGDGDLRLDGEQLELVEVALDNRVLPPVEYETRDDALIVHRVPDRFRLRTRVRIQPKAILLWKGCICPVTCSVPSVRPRVFDASPIFSIVRTSWLVFRSR